MAISGYTDTAEASEALAQARGEIVRDRLVALGLPANRIQIFAYGGNRLLVETPPNTPEQQNRYAELWFPNWR
ncbi:MAG TPA: OmpA family protein [Reyranella sp.]